MEGLRNGRLFLRKHRFKMPNAQFSNGIFEKRTSLEN